MNKREMTPKQFLEKCECEGGGIHNGFEYGLTPLDLDDSHEEFKEAVKEAYNLFTGKLFRLQKKY